MMKIIKNKIRDAIEESQKGIYLVNDVISCNDELSDDDDFIKGGIKK